MAHMMSYQPDLQHDEDDDAITAFLMIHQSFQQAARTAALIEYGTLLNATRHVPYKDDSSSESETESPGKGHTRDGLPKSMYAKRNLTSVYYDVRYTDPDVLVFENTVHMTREEFDALHTLTMSNIQTPMNVRQEFTADENESRNARKRRLNTEEVLFLFLDILGGPNEGGLGVKRAAMRYGVSPGTVSNYFRHALFAVYKSLDSVSPRLIRWPSAVERESMEGLIIGFPSCVFFVDGNKNRRWRPGNAQDQERAYDSYKHAHAFAIVVFCDIFGRFIRIEISDKGAESDRTMYTNSDVYQNPEVYLSNEQHGIADMGFAGGGNLVVPYKTNESTEWMYRVAHNRDIRKQRMVNEWSIGFINNRFRIFLGRWPFAQDLFPMCYKAAAMLSNWQFDYRSYALQTRERYEAKLTKHDLKETDSE